MYSLKSLKCKACAEWLPPLTWNLNLTRPDQIECPKCKEQRQYTWKDLAVRMVPGSLTDGPLYRPDWGWLRVDAKPAFYLFAPKNDPVEAAIRSLGRLAAGTPMAYLFPQS